MKIPAPLTEVARRGEPGAPYINSWLLLGTFGNDAQSSGYDRDFIGESNAAPQAGQSVDDQKWRYFDDRLFSRNYDDYNDLYSYFSVRQNDSSAAKVAYLHSYVYSPSAQNVQLRVGADTSFKAWINGTLAAASTRSTPDKPLPNGDVNNGGRDFVVVPAALTSGWNRLLLKIANTEDGRFGFYARFTTADGSAPNGLIYSTGGGDGKLAIENEAMPEAKSGALPVAWREWSYVGAQPDREKLLEMGQGGSGANGQTPPQIAGMGIGFTYNAGLGMSASPFRFSASGGKAPYSWTKSGGTLPTGMKLGGDGTLGGTPTLAAKLGDYKFAVQVRDNTGASATREYSLTLKERPNRWLEKGRLDALIHGPENIPAADVPKVAQQMKREGYALGMPISFNNGGHKFRYPSKFGENIAPDDRVALFKKSLEDAGVGFGMYMGNLNVNGATPFSVNRQLLMVREAMERYHPKALWFDWLGLDGTSLDSLFSAIKSLDPNIVIILNGSERISNGDWDVLAFEGWGAWGNNAWRTWPSVFPWPKKFVPETWRLSVEPTWELSGGLLSDWREMLRIQLSLIGEGFIANMDHSASLGKKTEPFADWSLIQLHGNMANWASPKNAPPLYEAYVNVDRGPLAAAAYGYNTINVKRDAIYILALKNPRGKVGLPADGKLNLGALPVKVKSVTLMNSNAPLPFSQSASTRALTINAKVVQDEAATIIKIALEKPLTETQAKAPPLPQLLTSVPTSPIPAGNLATGKPVWLRSADDSHDLGPSAGAMAIYGVDGDPKTLAVGGGEWAWSYKVDLKKVHTVRRIVVQFGEKLWATQYRVLTSQDGIEWTTVVVDDAGTPGTHVFNIAPIQARFVRVQSLKPDGPNQTGGQMAIAELQVFETAAPNVPVTPRPQKQDNLATGKSAKLLSMDGTRELGPSADSVASKGVDGDPATIAQAGGEYAWTYEVDLGKGATLGRVNITFGKGVWATEYNVLLSPDGKEWKTVAQVKDNGFGGVKSHSFAPTKARYVRVQAIKPDAPNQPGAQMGIAELEVFAK